MTTRMRCLLCGARMTASDLLDACEFLVDAEVPALGAHCPYCQGYFEVQPASGEIGVGYINRHSEGKFDALQRIAIEGLAVDLQRLPEHLELEAGERRWAFVAGEMDG